MSNIEYTQGGKGTFAGIISLKFDLDRETTTINYTDFNFPYPDYVKPGMAVMLNDEILRIETVSFLVMTVKRGCADTVPALHAAKSRLWIFDATTTGNDRKERAAGETIGVKVSPYTIGGGGVPSASVAPVAVTFNWRFFRPYPPGHLLVNGQRWHVEATIGDASPALTITWVHRDRVVQADQLIGHDDASVGPEAGTTYTMRVYSAEDPGVVVRTEVGLVGTGFTYQRSQALFDQDYPALPATTYFTFTSERDGFDAWQGYLCPFTVHPTEAIASNYLAFDQRAMESPYTLNARMAAPAVDGNYVLAMAARPADRMVDTYDMFSNTSPADSGDSFTPWVTSDFRLPELETILNIRTSSFFDGVSLAEVAPGQLCVLDDELVEVDRVEQKQIVLRRGCCDTVPAVHLPGARLWFIDAARSFDPTNRALGSNVQVKLRPFVYGPPVDLAVLPANDVLLVARSERPYAPGRIVVNGRPWFEEAVSISGGNVMFSWARRNRITIGGAVVDHSEADMPPEEGQDIVLRFYYETPSEAPGSPPAFHLLRDVHVTGTSYAYPYDLALIDGPIAGAALGVCGTVVIQCRIFATRDSLESYQSYVASVRVPSFSCVTP
jgi:hypothetical protein